MKARSLILALLFLATTAGQLPGQNGYGPLADGHAARAEPQEVLQFLPAHEVDVLPRPNDSWVDYLVYPELAADYNVEGRVTLRCTIDANGRVQRATVVRGLGFGCDLAAIAAVERMQDWQPARKDGKAVGAVVYVPVNFRLR